MDVQPHLLNLSAYINQNLEKDLPLSSLAKRVGLSPFHFHRKFGAYFGESLHQHIKRLRLERAAFALSYGSQPVREIARDSGYKTVSAFSHAFSMFAGQSPTRYRSLRPLARDEVERSTAVTDEPKPAWTGHIDDLSFGFVRAKGRGRGAQPTIEHALDAVRRMVARPRAEGDTSDDEAVDDEALDLIVATTDVYGIAKGDAYRVDVGVDAGSLPADRRHGLGLQTLPGGRYARFDITCDQDEVVERAYRAFLTGIAGAAQNARPAPCFVKFASGLPAGGTHRTYELFVPLAG